MLLELLGLVVCGISLVLVLSSGSPQSPSGELLVGVSLPGPNNEEEKASDQRIADGNVAGEKKIGKSRKIKERKG